MSIEDKILNDLIEEGYEGDDFDLEIKRRVTLFYEQMKAKKRRDRAAFFAQIKMIEQSYRPFLALPHQERVANGAFVALIEMKRACEKAVHFQPLAPATIAGVIEREVARVKGYLSEVEDLIVEYQREERSKEVWRDRHLQDILDSLQAGFIVEFGGYQPDASYHNTELAGSDGGEFHRYPNALHTDFFGLAAWAKQFYQDGIDALMSVQEQIGGK